MTEGRLRYTGEVPSAVEARIRRLCLALPDAYEEPAWVGTRWRVRKRTFARVLGVEDDPDHPLVVLAFRSTGEGLEVLRHTGHPFFVLGWGRNALGMVLDDDTDWDGVHDWWWRATARWHPRSSSGSSTAPGRAASSS